MDSPSAISFIVHHMASLPKFVPGSRPMSLGFFHRFLSHKSASKVAGWGVV
jgi:hypothetical protein